MPSLSKFSRLVLREFCVYGFCALTQRPNGFLSLANDTLKCDK